MIKVILWDIDGTLLNFLEAERCALRATFLKFGLGELSDQDIAVYSRINRSYWQRLERGEMSKPQILNGRFEEFFKLKGIAFNDFDAFNDEYQVRLGDTVRFVDRSDQLVHSLKGRVKQYAVTNGTRVAQERKLERSGLGRLFDGIFISETMGAEKPSNLFFDKVLNEIGDYDKNEIMIVGDSLTSDIKGGNNAGIICCWYDNGECTLPDDLTIHHRITHLWQVKEIIDA